MRWTRRTPWPFIVAAATAAACGNDPRDRPFDERHAPEASASARLEAPAASDDASAGSPSLATLIDEGRRLVGAFECARCHQGTGLGPVARDRDCVGCHHDIVAGRFDAPPDAIDEWRPRVAALTTTPSLSGVGRTVDPAFVSRYLVAPFDVRRHLSPTMPRLEIDAPQAAAIAAYLGSLAEPATQAREAGNVERGATLFAQKSCSRCHAYTGATPSTQVGSSSIAEREAAMLAPDLRFARERLLPNAVAAWIENPRSIRADTLMPLQGVTHTEAVDLAAFVMEAAIGPSTESASPKRLPVLDRPVGYDEVAERVLHRTCWHCHSEPDYARGDGGPGRTGGFGFKPRGLNLSSYEGVLAGYIDDQGERTSVVSSNGADIPLLVASLLTRRDEEHGGVGRVRGMPLGLPALSAEDIQLVESWVVQGHQR